MPEEDSATSGSATPADTEPLKVARHDVRGKLGVLYGAVQTALNKDLTLEPHQRVELINIAFEGLAELRPALERYLEALEGAAEDDDGAEIQLP